MKGFVPLYVLVLFGCSSGIHGQTTSATVYINNLSGAYGIVFGRIDKINGVAYGTFEDKIMTTGWGELNIVAGNERQPYTDDKIMHAAGYLEGVLTARLINAHYENIFGVFFKGDTDPYYLKATQFFTEQDKWMRWMIENAAATSSYWRQMKNIVAQFDGLIEGYQARPQTDKPLSRLAFQIMNAHGDLMDLKNALVPNKIDFDSMTEEEMTEKLLGDAHCSVLIKVLAGYENLLMSHASWFHYSTMLRIYKHYNINIKDPSTGSVKMSFSSYPALLSSLDDFYIMDSGLVLIQTTNPVLNISQYQYVRPQSLLAWHRVRLANLIARTGAEWASLISQYNSGTYNNQYMVLDLKRVELMKTLHDGALWVVEQIPGLVVTGDQTAILRMGYWPSYNIPYYEKIYNISGFPAFVQKHGAMFSYELTPRAKIMRRDEGQVRNISNMMSFLRYNDYKNDPYSNKSPMNTICSRGDLVTIKPSAFGCTDAKVADYHMAQSLTSYAVSGPTDQGLPPFQWSKYSFPDKHVGMPDVFQFKWKVMKPKTFDVV